MHKPRKRFGQHFLHDQRVVDRILDSFDPRQGETIVEIGPGQGALTAGLLERAGGVHAIELDRDLAAVLERRFAARGLVVHNADAAAFDYCALAAGRSLRIIGNLPYNISTPLLFYLLGQLECIHDMCFMLQKEVVDRICAPPGGKDYGRLSVMMQWRCRAEHLFDVAADAFTPPPKVESAVLLLVPYIEAPVAVDRPERFAALVRAAFAHRRKSLRNNLRQWLSAEQLEAVGIDPARRAETLSLEEFARLGNLID